MNEIFIKSVMMLIVLVFSLSAQDYMSAFPEAEPGMIRYVLHLPKQDNEDDLQVQLIAGKTVSIDKMNNYFFTGKIEQHTLQGWGFYLYKVGPLGPMAGTLIAVDPNTPKTKRFIALGGAPYLITYNSDVPLVVYAPEDVEVHYRIWSAGKSKKLEKESGKD